MKYTLLRLVPILARLCLLTACLCLLAACRKNTEPHSDIVATVAEDDTNAESESDGVMKSEKLTDSIINDETNDVTISSDVVTYSTDDYYTAWENENPNYIDLKGFTATLTGNGATIDTGIITIHSPGVYVFSGEINEGQIIVDLLQEGSVQLVLNGASIHSSEHSPIYIKNADKVILSLPEATENTITDGKSYDLSDKNNITSAAIYSKSDLTINGTGKLSLQANYKNGIVCNKTLKITNGTLNITSKSDGVIGKNMIAAIGGTLIIHAGGDGLKSFIPAKDKSENLKGIVVLDGGNFIITAQGNGIEAVNDLLITGGEYSIVTGGGNESSLALTNVANSSETTEETESIQNTPGDSMGLIAASITINGGIYTFDSSGDSLHSKDSLTINDGNFTITSDQVGIHADASLFVTNGTINITKSYEGIEGTEVTVLDGNINILSDDDGINIAGGNDRSAISSLESQEEPDSSIDKKLTISGGYIHVEAVGDGFDSAGSIEMTEGTVIIYGPIDDNNTSVDYKDAFTITGGVFLTADTSAKITKPSANSSQNTIIYTFDKVQDENSLLHIQDKNGNEIITFAPNKKYQNILVSTADVKRDKSYSLYVKGSSNGESINGYYKNGTYKKGVKIIDFTVSDKVTLVKN